MGPTEVVTTGEAAGNGALLAIVTVLLGSTVLATLFTTAMGNVRTAAAARRDRYAQVVRTLVAWVEYPYRIRRRTNDDPGTLAALADRGHSLQEQMAEDRAWVAGENRALGEVYDGCLADLTRIVRPASTEAWVLPPITKSADMVLGSFGPRDTAAIIARMNCAIGYRFGARRVMWRPWLRQRLRARGCVKADPPIGANPSIAPVSETRPPEAVESTVPPS
jgi:hypothetical protein